MGTKLELWYNLGKYIIGGYYMRDIKFRVWDNERNAMFNSKSVDVDFFEGKIEITSDTIRYDEVYTDEIKDFELMQYVGCKDKNNKEIYEGDIVKTKEHIGQIIYSKGMFFIDVKGDFYLPIYNVLEFMEVIGNIYENPELLESDKF